jgi:hypothetical protein
MWEGASEIPARGQTNGLMRHSSYQLEELPPPEPNPPNNDSRVNIANADLELGAEFSSAMRALQAHDLAKSKRAAPAYHHNVITDVINKFNYLQGNMLEY